MSTIRTGLPWLVVGRPMASRRERYTFAVYGSSDRGGRTAVLFTNEDAANVWIRHFAKGEKAIELKTLDAVLAHLTIAEGLECTHVGIDLDENRIGKRYSIDEFRRAIEAAHQGHS